MDPVLERYSRQMRFYGVKEEGQKRLADKHVTLCGCGALGTVLANSLVRPGVGQCASSIATSSNQQPAALCSSTKTTSLNLPGGGGGAQLATINSDVHVEPVARHDRTNILELCKDDHPR